MFVYGDLIRTESPREKLDGIAGALRRLAGMPAGIERHGALVAALIEAGELAQGIADARFAQAGERDARWPDAEAAMALLAHIAGAVRASWESGFARLGPVPEAEIALLIAARFPETVRTKRAEGFALYSLYPESYVQAAAAALGDAEGPVRVIGIRSIGAPLAALVAAATGAPPPLTVRPVGHPYHRRLTMAEDLKAVLLAGSAARFAVADEGPGLSGGSFGAVADFLEDHGIAPERIHFFPSHWGSPGPRANPRHRERWARSARHAVDLGTLLLHAARRPEHRLDSWAAELVGRADEPAEEISTGRWRAHRYAREADWPAAKVQLERRKFLLRAGGGTWLMKFVGLGQEGARKLERARALQAAGFIPPVAGFRHGFLIEQWIAEAHSLDRQSIGRDRLVAQLGRYLGFRARHFPAEAERGASLAVLWEMARRNARLALGSALARSLYRWTREELDRLERRVHRVETDNRLHAWEWLLPPDGRILKADALDHHAGHDLVGCQDIAWDIAGAAVEFGLSETERDRLCAMVESETGRGVDPRLIALLEPCYLAFQMGDHAMAADGAAGWAAEPDRLRAAAAGYRDKLQRVLAPDA